MKKMKIISKDKKENKSSMFFGIVLLILLIMSVLFLLSGNQDSDKSIVHAASEPREDVDPDDYPDLTYGTAEEALSEANSQLSGMTEGNIYTVDGFHEDFVARLLLDHMMGNIIYWELSSPEITVSINAYNGEIIYYHHSDWTDGTLTQQEIAEKAELIAEQFAEIPDDSEEPDINLDDSCEFTAFDDDGNDTTVTWTFWYVEYMGSKDDIISEDKIILYINPNGDLNSYSKTWNMDLADLDTTYTVSEEDAENTALQYTGGGSTVHDTYKYIVRPKNYWHVDGIEDLSFGLEPVSVWVVLVEDAEYNLCVYHIHGKENTIVGGDFIADYYVES